MIMSFATFTASFASAIFSATVGSTSKQFGVSTGATTLGVTLYVLGFASGPTLWAPASELSGRWGTFRGALYVHQQPGVCKEAGSKQGRYSARVAAASCNSRGSCFYIRAVLVSPTCRRNQMGISC